MPITSTSLGNGIAAEGTSEQLRINTMHRRANERAKRTAEAAAAAAPPPVATPEPKKRMIVFKPKMPGMKVTPAAASAPGEGQRPRKKLVLKIRPPTALARQMHRATPVEAAV